MQNQERPRCERRDSLPAYFDGSRHFALRSDRVPVGKRPKQHVEIAPGQLPKNSITIFGETFNLPEPDIREETATPDADRWSKMSKSWLATPLNFCRRVRSEKNKSANIKRCWKTRASQAVCIG